MDSLKVELPKETTTEELLAEIEKLNANPDVHGILYNTQYLRKLMSVLVSMQSRLKKT